MTEPKAVKIKEPTLLLNISVLYPEVLVRDDYARDLYEATRAEWKLDPVRASRAELVMAVFYGHVVGVFRPRPDSWVKAGTRAKEYRFRDASKFDPRRWEFTADPAEPEVRRRYLGQWVGKGKQNPGTYVNM